MPALVVSHNERLLLHLLDGEDFRKEAEVPMALCQEGIAERLGTQVHNVSRSLATLQSDGLVEDRLAHIRGAPRRRRAYFLTEKGRAVAMSIRDDLLSRPVSVKEKEGVKETTLGDVLKSCSPRKGMTLSRLLEAARDGDVLDLSEDVTERNERNEPRSRSIGRPRPALFLGRAKELAAASSVLQKEDGLVLIWGLPGIGKTALGSKLYEDTTIAPAFWYTIREWDTSSSLMKELIPFLKVQGRAGASAAWSRSHALPDLFPALVSDFQKIGGIVFLDDVHKASGELRSTVAMLVEATRAGGTRMVLMARSIPPFVSLARPDALSLQLGGLDEGSAAALAQELQVSDVQKVVDQSHRHPLIIRLMALSTSDLSGADVSAFIEGEIALSIDADERRAIEFLSIYRLPVGTEALPGTSAEALTRLRRKGLVMEGEGGLWAHEVVREHFAGWTSADELKRMHGLAARYYEGCGETIEAVYHRLASGERERALELFLREAEEAMDEPQEVLSLTENMTSSSAGQRAELHFWRGEALSELGRSQEALTEYALCTEGGSVLPPELEGRLFEGVAKVQTEVGRWAESLASHERALMEYERRSDRLSQAREWLNIGAVHRKRGDHQKAREAYLRAPRIHEDDRVRAASQNNLALLDWSEGRMEGAEEQLRESLTLARRSGDVRGEARALANLIELYMQQYRLEEAAGLLQDSTGLFAGTLEGREYSKLIFLIVGALSQAGRRDEAVGLSRRAVTELERYGPKAQQACSLVRAFLVALLRDDGNSSEAWSEAEKGLSALGRSGDPSLRARFVLEEALIAEGRGDMAEAALLLDRAEKLLREGDNAAGLAAVAVRRGMLQESLGALDKAASDYRHALRQAERANDRRGMAVALEGLSRVLEKGSPESAAAKDRASGIYRDLGMADKADRLRPTAGADQI